MTLSNLTLRLLVVLLFVSNICAQDTAKRIGAIDFFGYSGIDLNKVRAALPIREGEPFDAMDPKIGRAHV